jgi:hypothetical protein
MRQVAVHGMLVTSAPVTWTVTPSTDAPDGSPVTAIVMAIGKAQGSARQSWLQDADAKAPRTARTAGVNPESFMRTSGCTWTRREAPQEPEAVAV